LVKIWLILFKTSPLANCQVCNSWFWLKNGNENPASVTSVKQAGPKNQWAGLGQVGQAEHRNEVAYMLQTGSHPLLGLIYCLCLKKMLGNFADSCIAYVYMFKLKILAISVENRVVNQTQVIKPMIGCHASQSVIKICQPYAATATGLRWSSDQRLQYRDRDSNKMDRWIREAIYIRKEQHTFYEQRQRRGVLSTLSSLKLFFYEFLHF